MASSAGSFLSSFAGGFQTGRDLKQEDERLARGVTDDAETNQGTSGTTGRMAAYDGSSPSGSPTQGRSVMGGDYAGFNSSLSNTESGGNYSARNSEGYSGKYQFGQARLDDYNNSAGTSYTTDQLLKDPALQETVQNWHVADIDSYITKNGLDQYVGQNVGGVTLTQDSLRAMAHLGGNAGMAKFLTTGGEYNPADSNGTHLSDYARTHAGASSAGQSTKSSSATGAGQTASAKDSLGPLERGVLSLGETIVQTFYK